MKTFAAVCFLLIAAVYSNAAPQFNGNEAYNHLLDQFQQSQENFQRQNLAFQQQFQDLFNQQAVLGSRGGFTGAGAFSSASGGASQGFGNSVGVTSQLGSRFGGDDGKSQFFSVTSTRFAEDVDNNGVRSRKQGGKTIVNNNGKITEYPLDK